MGFHTLYCDGLSVEARFPRERYPKLKASIEIHPMGKNIQWFTPRQAILEEITDIHDEQYVQRFIDGSLTPKEKRQIGLRPWNPEIVERTLYLTGGSIQALHYAVQSNGYAGNLAGGTHHAFKEHGAGYCIFNDIAIAAIQAIELGLERVTVLDLDVHQGDGTASICRDMPNIQTISVHCEKNYPFRKQLSDVDIPLPAMSEDHTYLIAVDKALEFLREFNPSMVIYQAGVDGLNADRLGKLNLTREGLDQNERCKALEFDLQKTLVRIDDQNRVVEQRSYDIRNKGTSLDDTEKEIARVKDLNTQQNVEITALRRDVDRVSTDCYDYRK